MKPVTHLFQELVRDVHSRRWNEDDLAKLSGVELHALTKLLSCPSSGVKHSVIVRLLAYRQLRFKLAPFSDDPIPLANAYRRESLRDMCKKAGIWRSGNKRQLAAGLLTWRNRCRLNGHRFLADMNAVAAARPRQLSFSF
jgi:hypothetical protein